MAIQVTPPEQIGFSKDVILWRFQDDRAGITPGVNAEAFFSVGDKVLDGTQIIFRWGANDLRFTARETVGEYGNEIPVFPEYSPAAHEAYIKSLVPYFQNNLFLSRDYDIVAEGVEVLGATIWVVKLTAKNRGTAYNFTPTNFAGGGIKMAVDGTDDSVIANNSVYVEVWVQSADESIFELKYGAPQLFDSQSAAEFDVASVLHACLASEIPDMLLPIAERCTQSRRKYYLRYALYGGNPPSAGQIQQTEEFVVLLGGFAQWEQGPKSVLDTFMISPTQSRIMKLRPALRTVRMDEPVFVSWLNTGAAGRNIHARATVFFADGSQVTTNTGVISAVQEYDKLIFGVGFKQLNLGFFHGQGQIVREFVIELRDDLGPVSDEYRLVVDYGHREFVRYFAHVNSYGCIETLMTCGKGSSYWKVFKEQAQKVLPYQFNSSQAQFVEWNATYQDNQEVATGWMRKKDLLLWLDLFIAALKYRVIDGKPYAIQINSDTIQKGADGDNQHALTFEYQFARIFDSVNEELLEGEDSADIIPPNVVLAGSGGNGNGNGAGSAAPAPASNVFVDPYPIAGSKNAVSSDGMLRALEAYQKKLPLGDAEQYINGQHKLSNMRQAVNSYEKDPTVPTYAKSLTNIFKIVSDLQALPPENGLNVSRLGGQLAEWYIQRMTHPAFDRVPPIVVERGVAFEKYVDLSLYKTSFHPDEDLTVEISFNTDKLSGVAVTADGLQITLKGTINELVTNRDNVLLVVRDLAKNQATVALRVQNIESEEPEEPGSPDNRPVCQKGPYHYLKLPIEVFSNSHFRAPFDADGVNPIDWVLATTESADNPLRSGRSGPYNGTAFIDVTLADPIAAGKYLLGIRGVLCKSPWAWREITFPVNSNLNWSAGYPKYERQETYSAFLAMVDTSGRYLTQLLNLTTNTTVYSEENDYVANVTVMPIVKNGGWPDGNYRLIVGTLSKDIPVSTVPEPTHIFKLVHGWDGELLADLTQGPYEGPTPSGGYNGYMKINKAEVPVQAHKWMLEKKVAGNWVHVTTVGGGGVTTAGATWLSPMRLISTPGVDSRSIVFQNASLNRGGEYRFTVILYSGDLESTPVSRIYQQLFTFHAFEILGTVTNLGSARYQPLISKVLYNGQNVVNDNTWAQPFASLPKKLEYSVDGGTTWYSDVSAAPDLWGGSGAYSNVWILNNNQVNNFPAGSRKQVIFRNPALPDVRSAPFTVNQSGTVSGDLKAKSFAGGWWEHVKWEKVMTESGVVFNDLNPNLPAPGTEFWYIFNREIIKRSTPLTGYQYPKGKPYGVYKIQVKIGWQGTLWGWHGQAGTDESIATPFSNNSSIAFETGVQNKK